jgi:hypothetical protein
VAKTDRAKQALPYLRGLADDEYVQEQIRNALDGLASVSRRIARKRGKAAEDKKLYDNLRQAATSVRNASHALQRRKAEPKRRGRKVVAAVAVGGGIAVLISQRDRLKSTFGNNGASDTGPDPDAYPHPDGAPVPGQSTGTGASSLRSAAPGQAWDLLSRWLGGSMRTRVGITRAPLPPSDTGSARPTSTSRSAAFAAPEATISRPLSRGAEGRHRPPERRAGHDNGKNGRRLSPFRCFPGCVRRLHGAECCPWPALAPLPRSRCCAAGETSAR